MSATVGIPPYKDLINKIKLAKIKDEVNTVAINFANMTSKSAIDNRENESYETYSEQYKKDLIYLKNMCLAAQQLVNTCNETLFLISTDAIEHHIYNYDNE